MKQDQKNERSSYRFFESRVEFSQRKIRASLSGSLALRETLSEKIRTPSINRLLKIMYLPLEYLNITPIMPKNYADSE